MSASSRSPGGIEIRRWFVHHEYLGLHGQDSCDGHPATLAVTEVMRRRSAYSVIPTASSAS